MSTEVIYAYAVNLDCSHSASQPRLSVVRRSSCLRLRAAKYEDVIATRQSTKVVVMGGVQSDLDNHKPFPPPRIIRVQWYFVFFFYIGKGPNTTAVLYKE